MAKTPYEIRLDLLNIAREHLMQQYHSEYNWTRARLEATQQPFLDELLPSYPQLSDIVKLADEMKNFVDNP